MLLKLKRFYTYCFYVSVSFIFCVLPAFLITLFTSFISQLFYAGFLPFLGASSYTLWTGGSCYNYKWFFHMQGTLSAGVKLYSICTFLYFILLIKDCFYLFNFLVVSNFLFSFKLSNLALCKHCTSMLFVQDKTCSLVILLVSFIIVISFLISTVIVWLLMPFMNCSFSCLFPCIYILWLWPSIYPSTLLLIHLNALKFTVL